MNIEIVGRQIDITPAIRDFTEDKLRKLEKLLDGPFDAHVVLAIEKHRHMAEIKVMSRTAILSGQEETDDLYNSIREVADKLERQALKHKEKVTNRKHRKGPKFGEAVAAMDEQALARMEPNPEAASGQRIVRTPRYRVKPLSAEDAVLELESSGEELLVFRDADTDRVNVIYRLDDGNFALVDPEF